MRRDRFFWLGLWGVAALLGAPGCTKPRSVLSLHVSTDERWGDGATLQSLVVSVHRGGMDGPLRCTEGDAFGCPMVLRLGTGAGQTRLPLTFQLTPTEASDETGVWVEVLGCGAAAGCASGEAVASWSRALTYTSERTETVEVFLTRGRDAGTGTDADASEVADGDVPSEAADVLDARDVEDAPEVVDAPDAVGAQDVFDAGVAVDTGVDVASEMPCMPPRMECGGRCVEVQTDVSNCGGCGRACGSTGGTATCVGGVCGIVCSPGQGDCDMNASNGCETSTATSAAHCGRCGNVCNLANATPACVGGQCVVTECRTGFADCDRNAANGCEQSTTTDNAHCGSCGRVCAAGQSCMGGVCMVVCPSGRTACGMNCFDLGTDAANCGSCGRACRTDQACMGGACGCPSGQTECSGRCVDLTREPYHCGRCGTECESGRCTSGVCVCPTGQTRCGMGASSVCVDVQTSRVNCGMCSRSCDVNSVCERGACVAAQRSCRSDVDGGVSVGCGLVRVERGTFTMGAATDCNTPDAGVSTCAYNAAPPQSNVTVDAFTLDAHEVTVGRFRAFWRARMAESPNPGGSIRAQPIRYPNFNGTTRQEIAWGTGAGREPDPQSMICNWSLSPSSRDAHPINCVDWWTAQEFCVWDRGPGTYGTLQNGRLPTEAEWEYAARGRAVPGEGLTAGRTYPWGEGDPQGSSTTTCNRAQWNNCVGEDGGSTRRVGRFAATGGFFDLAGNVWEWTADNYATYGASCVTRMSSQNYFCNNSAIGDRVSRGGSWGSSVANLRSASRNYNAPVFRGDSVGFRCAGTLTE